MPIRKSPLIKEYYYHIFNRGVEKRITFIDSADYHRFFLSLSYYRYPNPPTKLSTFLKSKPEARALIRKRLLQSSDHLVTVLSYCLMPNHFHLLLRQNTENGITSYLRKITDSYTKYFNKRYQRIGPLLQGRFKSVLIEHDEELLHVSRYIHLNPFTANMSMKIEDCLVYPWSSGKYYTSSETSFINTKIILSHFNNHEGYKEFILEQGGYQRTLAALRSEHIEDIT